MMGGFVQRDFNYSDKTAVEKMLLQVPKGFTREKMVLDTVGGKEQFYNYANGAIVYFSKDISWLTENALLVRQAKRSSNDGTVVWKGIDKDGLYWKEIKMEGFRFGYSYVPPAALEQFEQAVNFVRVRPATSH